MIVKTIIDYHQPSWPFERGLRAICIWFLHSITLNQTLSLWEYKKMIANLRRSWLFDKFSPKVPWQINREQYGELCILMLGCRKSTSGFVFILQHLWRRKIHSWGDGQTAEVWITVWEWQSTQGHSGSYCDFRCFSREIGNFVNVWRFGFPIVNNPWINSTIPKTL